MFSRKKVFAAACMGMLLFGMVMISLGSILPFVTEKFELGGLATGTLASVLPLGILLGSMIFGPVADRYGYQRLLIIGSLLTITALEGIAFTSNLLVLQLSMFLIGFGGGLLNGSTNALVADISEATRSADLSVLGVFFGIGALGMPAVLGFLNNYFPFETIISLIGALIAGPLIFFMVIRFPSPKNTQGLPIRECVKLLKDPLLVLLGLVLFFQSGLEGLVNNWTTTFLQNVRGFTLDNSLFTLSLFVLGLTLTRIILGKILRSIAPYIVMITSTLLIVSGALILMFTATDLLSTLATIIIGIGFAAGFPVILGYVGSIYAHISGTAFSIVITIALIGNVLSNYIMGRITNAFGINQLPLVILIFAVLMLVILLSSLRKISQKTTL
ncbi:MAG: MFS transporter [Bacteroidetes bacterium]|nr:MFS transporter [Bacteroidota bacterium]MDA1121168.1 MFS transporter [Bacteroidota bacterium]